MQDAEPEQSQDDAAAAEQSKPGRVEPLEGFDIQNYDRATETVTVQIHKSMLDKPDQRDALFLQLTKAFGESVSRVDINPRK